MYHTIHNKCTKIYHTLTYYIIFSFFELVGVICNFSTTVFNFTFANFENMSNHIASTEIDLEPPKLAGSEQNNRPIQTTKSVENRKNSMRKETSEPEGLPSAPILTKQQRQRKKAIVGVTHKPSPTSAKSKTPRAKKAEQNAKQPNQKDTNSSENGAHESSAHESAVAATNDTPNDVSLKQKKPSSRVGAKKKFKKTKAQLIKENEPEYLIQHTGNHNHQVSLHRFHWSEDKPNDSTSYREIFALVDIHSVTEKPMPRNKKGAEVVFSYGATMFHRDDPSEKKGSDGDISPSHGNKNNVLNFYMQRMKSLVKKKYPEWTDSEIEAHVRKLWNNGKEHTDGKISLREQWGQKYVNHLKEMSIATVSEKQSKKRKRGTPNATMKMPNERGHFQTAMGRLLVMPVEAKLDVYVIDTAKSDQDTKESVKLSYTDFKTKLREQFHKTGVCNWNARSVDWERVRDLADSNLPKAKRLRMNGSEVSSV